jgi:hypothetical protein
LWAVGCCNARSDGKEAGKKTVIYILEDLMPIVENSAGKTLHKETRVKTLLLPALGQSVVPCAERRNEISETERHRLKFPLAEYECIRSVDDLPMPIKDQLEEAKNELKRRQIQQVKKLHFEVTAHPF